MASGDRVLFLCERSGVILDGADPAILGAGARVPVPCGGRVEIQHLLKAVERGAREVLVVACPLDNCRSQLGTEEAERRVRRANALLAEAGTSARCRIVRAAANAPHDLTTGLAALATEGEVRTMIIADRKPFEEIVAMLGDARQVLVAACNTCVTVCHAGGKREAALLASQLRIHAAEAGLEREVRETVLERHCDAEFVDALAAEMEWPDAFVSTACGVGVNYVADRFPAMRVLPALNTTFYGATDAPGRWQEMCGGCGDCVLDRTAGICPVVRCAKAIQNGPCGGCQEGRCEVAPDVPCAWQEIIERLTAQGRAESLEVVLPPKDWSVSTHGGWRRARVVEEFANAEEVGQ